ncbi:MAG: tyrosine-type recombinase/integrase [Sphingomicrobium sp.]
MARLTDTRVAAIKPPAAGQEEHSDDLVTGLRLRVGAGGRKAWIVRTRAGGKPINKTLGAYPVLKLSDARDAAKALLRDIALTGAPRQSKTFGELVDHWIEHVAKPNNRSWEKQKRRLEIHVLPHWQSRQLDSIRRADVRDLIDGIPGDVAPNRALTIIRTLFRYAMSRDWIEASPAEAIAKPKSESPRDRVLDMDEVKWVYSTADMLGYPLAGYLKMLFLTGQRRTEVGMMRWEDLNLEQGTWTITSADTKAARAHLVPLPPQAVSILKATPRLGTYVWTTDGKRYLSGYTHVKARLDGLLAAQGARLKAWRLHDIRRSVATHMVRLGVTETIVGRVLNHAAQGVTAKVYALHSYEPEKRSALTRWAAEIERAIAGRSAEKVVAISG